MKAAYFGVFGVRFAALQDQVPFVRHSNISGKPVEFHVLRLAGERCTLWHCAIITHLRESSTLLLYFTTPEAEALVTHRTLKLLLFTALHKKLWRLLLFVAIVITLVKKWNHHRVALKYLIWHVSPFSLPTFFGKWPLLRHRQGSFFVSCLVQSINRLKLANIFIRQFFKFHFRNFNVYIFWVTLNYFHHRTKDEENTEIEQLRCAMLTLRRTNSNWLITSYKVHTDWLTLTDRLTTWWPTDPRITNTTIEKIIVPARPPGIQNIYRRRDDDATCGFGSFNHRLLNKRQSVILNIFYILRSKNHFWFFFSRWSTVLNSHVLIYVMKLTPKGKTMTYQHK